METHGRPGRHSLRAAVDNGLSRRFWSLFSASFLANLSDGIFQFALPLLAVSLTTEPGLEPASRSPRACRGSSSP